MNLCLVALVISMGFSKGIPPEESPQNMAAKIREGGERALQDFLQKLSQSGADCDLKKGLLSFEATILDPQMPMEYLVVGNRGATHESLLVSAVRPSLLCTAVHLMGIDTGKNVRYQEKNPPPKEEELAEGVLPYEVIAPEGPGVFIYLQWDDAGEKRTYRAEDLILNTKAGRTIPRVRWVFLGSRMLPASSSASASQGEPRFAADLEENLVSVCFFATGNQLFTNPNMDGQEQHLFFPNRWLLPAKGSKVRVIFSKDKLE